MSDPKADAAMVIAEMGRRQPYELGMDEIQLVCEMLWNHRCPAPPPPSTEKPE